MRAPSLYTDLVTNFGTAFTKTVTVKGTQVQVTTTETRCKGAYVQALPTNTEAVVVGGSNADVATYLGFSLQAYDYVFLPFTDLRQIYIDGKAGEGVSVIPLN